MIAAQEPVTRYRQLIGSSHTVRRTLSKLSRDTEKNVAGARQALLGAITTLHGDISDAQVALDRVDALVADFKLSSNLLRCRVSDFPDAPAGSITAKACSLVRLRTPEATLDMVAAELATASEIGALAAAEARKRWDDGQDNVDCTVLLADLLGEMDRRAYDMQHPDVRAKKQAFNQASNERKRDGR